ncbi:MAG TPA: hypothetical protein VFU22_32500 [Roseiflexaceae bacterium]|nr:hypothetical protein [Roseiflexaceae bacterium]
MRRTIECPAGQWTAIFDHAFVQLPRTWAVSFAAVDGGTVAGEVIEKRSTWIFPNPPIARPLVAVMSFKRGWWNTFYSVRVKPTRDVIAQIG